MLLQMPGLIEPVPADIDERKVQASGLRRLTKSHRCWREKAFCIRKAR
jgi:hypothetical protein